MVLECTAVDPETKKESIATKNWRQLFGSYTRRKNEHDKFAAAIYHDKRVLGHGPKNGLEIPVKYKFIGLEKAIIW